MRIIDGTKMIDWINHFPAVESWLSQIVGGNSLSQVKIPMQHWNEVSSIGEPPSLTPDLFLANRTEAIAKLNEVFEGTSLRLRLSTYYPYQVVNFVSAYLASLVDDVRASHEHIPYPAVADPLQYLYY